MDADADDPANSAMWDVLRVGAVVEGLAAGESVTVVAVDRFTDESANVAYRTDTGIVEKIVYADSLSRLGGGMN